MTFTANRPYDISPDGQRFLKIKEDKQTREAAEAVETPPITELIVVDNWDEVLKDHVPVEGQWEIKSGRELAQLAEARHQDQETWFLAVPRAIEQPDSTP